MSSEPALPSTVPPAPPVDDAIRARLSSLAHQQELWLAALNAVGDPIIPVVISTADDQTSVTTRMSKAVGQAFDTWAGLVQGHDSQLSILLPKSLYEAHTDLREARTRIGELEAKLDSTLSTMEGIKLANDSLLLERLGGISVKLSSLSERCTKVLEPPAGPAPPKGSGSNNTKTSQASKAHTPTPKASLPKGKKRPAIFAPVTQATRAEPPSKRPASTTETQRVQEAYAIPRDWDWKDINAIGPLMQVCKGRIHPEVALTLTKFFEFRLRSAAPPEPTGNPNPAPTFTFAAVAAAPANVAPPPTGPALAATPTSGRAATQTPALQTARPPPKPKAKLAPVVHVPAPRDPTKILRVVFSAAVTNAAYRRELPDTRTWVRDQLERIGQEPNEVVDLTWHAGGVHADIRFQARPAVAIRDHLNQMSDWFALHGPGMSRSATIDFYCPVTRLAIKALRTHHRTTREEFAPEDIISAIMGENTWIAPNVLAHIQSPRPFWLDRSGGSGTFIFAAYDNQNGSVSEGWCKKKIRLFGEEHLLTRYDTTPRIPLCNKCWHWQHSGSACKAGKIFCSLCSLPHVDADHSRYCAHPECVQTRIDTLEPRTTCSHVYCANCDSLDHAPSARECPFNRHANNKDAHAWFEKHRPKFSANDLRNRRNAYDGVVAVERETRRRVTVEEAGDPPSDDDDLYADEEPSGGDDMVML